MELEYKMAYAEYERQQEEAAFMSKFQRDLELDKQNQKIQVPAKSVKVTPYTTKEQLVNVLKEQIASNPNQAKKALLRVYQNQTSDEKRTQSVRIYNNIGFTPVDADFLSSLAECLRTRGTLSEKQTTYLQKIMPKYARQLVEGSLAEGKIVKQGKFYAYVK